MKSSDILESLKLENFVCICFHRKPIFRGMSGTHLLTYAQKCRVTLHVWRQNITILKTYLKFRISSHPTWIYSKFKNTLFHLMSWVGWRGKNVWMKHIKRLTGIKYMLSLHHPHPSALVTKRFLRSFFHGMCLIFRWIHGNINVGGSTVINYGLHCTGVHAHRIKILCIIIYACQKACMACISHKMFKTQ